MKASNNTNENILASRICAVLDESAAQLDLNVQKRLANARDLALAQIKTAPAGVTVAETELAMAGGPGFDRPGFSWRQRFGLALPVVLLVAGLIGLYEWQQAQRMSELADIDAAVLSDDLPLNAYLDKGFGQFLHKAGDE